MNCKPGDLAIVVRVDQPIWGFCLGRLFRLEASYVRNGATYWKYEGETVYSEDGRNWVIGWGDHELCPIRPGDISDEEVRDLFSPVKEEA